MNKKYGRYKVSFEEGGVDYCSYTDDIDEAVEYAKEKSSSSDHLVCILDEADGHCSCYIDTAGKFRLDDMNQRIKFAKIIVKEIGV